MLHDLVEITLMNQRRSNIQSHQLATSECPTFMNFDASNSWIGNNLRHCITF